MLSPGVPKGLAFEHLSLGPGKRLVLRARTAVRATPCPPCGGSSGRVHSRYGRTLSELPWHGVAVSIRVRARRFLCDRASCGRRIFCERLPDAAVRARKTGRLEEVIRGHGSVRPPGAPILLSEDELEVVRCADPAADAPPGSVHVAASC